MQAGLIHGASNKLDLGPPEECTASLTELDIVRQNMDKVGRQYDKTVKQLQHVVNHLEKEVHDGNANAADTADLAEQLREVRNEFFAETMELRAAEQRLLHAATAQRAEDCTANLTPPDTVVRRNMEKVGRQYDEAVKELQETIKLWTQQVHDGDPDAGITGDLVDQLAEITDELFARQMELRATEQRLLYAATAQRAGIPLWQAGAAMWQASAPKTERVCFQGTMRYEGKEVGVQLLLDASCDTGVRLSRSTAKKLGLPDSAKEGVRVETSPSGVREVLYRHWMQTHLMLDGEDPAALEDPYRYRTLEVWAVVDPPDVIAPSTPSTASVLSAESSTTSSTYSVPHLFIELLRVPKGKDCGNPDCILGSQGIGRLRLEVDKESGELRMNNVTCLQI